MEEIMPLPRMMSPDPKTVPASEEKTLPDLYMTHLRMAALSDGDKRAMVTLCRYNYDTGELSPDAEDSMTHVIESVAAEAERVPLFAQTVAMIVQVTELLVKERWLVERIAVTEDPTERAVLEAELETVRTGLGIV
jgi:hypothetical protein